MKAKIDLALVNRLKREIKEASPEREYEIRDTALPGFVLRVKPSGKLVYTMVYARGKRKTIATADEMEPKEARGIAEKIASDHIHAEHGIGEDPIEKDKRKKADSYEQFLETLYKPHLEANLRKGVNNHENVRETMACLKGRFNGFLKVGLNEITPLMIEKWRQSRSKEGVKPASINRQLNDLRACLNRAVKWGALDSSPFDKVEAIKIDSARKIRFLTAAEEIKLRAEIDKREAKLKAARKSGNAWRAERGQDHLIEFKDNEFFDYLKPAVLLSLNTGLRQGELFSLTWANVDFDQKNLTVVGELAKDGETRHIPLNQEAMTVLKIWKNQPGLKGALVFPGEDGKPIAQPRKPWVGVLKEAEIFDFRWHDLRHTFASNLVMSGVDLNTVRELLGHSDYKMTLRYAHLAPKHKQDAVDRLTPLAVAGK